MLEEDLHSLCMRYAVRIESQCLPGNQTSGNRVSVSAPGGI